jgi:competence protein ComEC
MYDASAELIETGQGRPLWAALFTLKARGLAVLSASFPEPHASLLAGILLGVETGLSPGLEEAFQATGTSHIVAISGFNFAILIGVLDLLSRRALGGRRGLPLSLAVIALYALLVGAGGSVVRAALMGGLALLAGQVGRRPHALNGLAAAALIMTAANPLTLWDVGFQLSAAATLGLVLFAGRFEAGLRAALERFSTPGRARQATAVAVELILASLAAQVTTLPLIILYFRQLSLISLLANALILPVQPLVMAGGGAALLLGLVWPVLGQMAAWLAWPFTAYTMAVVEALARVPYAVLYLGEVAAPLVTLYYAGLVTLTVWLSRPKDSADQPMSHPHRAPAAGLVLLGSIALVLWGWQSSLLPANGRLRITVLDIGSPAEAIAGGEAVLIQTPGGASVLIGGGPGDLTLARALDRTLPLFTRRLDLLVIASPADQHLGALPETVRRFEVGRVVFTTASGGSTSHRVLLDRLQNLRVEIITASGLPALDLGQGVSLRVLADGEQGSVLRLDWQRFSLVLAPRVDAQAEADLAGLGLAQPATALLLARGGSAAASSEAWLQALNPRLAIISASAGQPGAAAPEVLERLAGRTVLRTDLNGDIRLETDGVQMWVTTEK